MAAISLTNVAKTATLVANTADTVTLAANTPTPSSIEVVNLDTSALIWARADGTATVAGDDCIPVPANSAYIFAGITSLSLVSTGTPQYTVDRLV